MDAAYDVQCNNSLFTDGMIENYTNLICISSQFEYIAIHCRCNGTHLNRLPKVSLATDHYVAGYENH